MTFPNAYKGVKKLHTAQVLGLISAILGVVIAIFVVLSVAAISTQNESATVVFGLLILVVGIAAGVLAIIAYILQIVGLKNASHDDNSFYTAFVFAIIGLVLTVLATIFSSLNVANGFGDDIASLFTKFSTIIITAFVIIGVSNLAGKLEQSAMAQRAKSVGTLQIVILALSIVASIIALFTGNAATIISG
ncbi:MAG: hypothetical protein IKF06_06715, partial [Lachnospiraceae bacterium]|nr:hypothetical protein [Lachnospiraceae bacterium]